MAKFQIGDRVKLTGKHLQSTGQYAGPAGLSTWTITGIDGNWAITDQPLSAAALQSYTAAELADDPTLAFRHIALANLRKVL